MFYILLTKLVSNVLLLQKHLAMYRVSFRSLDLLKVSSRDTVTLCAVITSVLLLCRGGVSS